MCVCVWLCYDCSVLEQVKVDLVKVPNRSLGFSIAGGKGSTPAYEDVDEVIIYLFPLLQIMTSLVIKNESIHDSRAS